MIARQTMPPRPDFQEVERLLERALDELRSGDDPLPTLSHAIAAYRVQIGELPADELDEVEPPCICPPDLLERDGFRGGCPRHGNVVMAGGA